ncbi:hypothetical protein GCM10010885_08190 [Alicyclobacillus cellulosilyticus]|uniref:Major facilitator superfamily (MFS) profile domain-containing protein n=1 Tax=Alicyclobacillus cellulosilyticus TaxID=1003997 RepID=A0A917K780_9BACL|nr:MFS transporter [Alicyclobacillus cellulosilyticus]GGJ01355.1 hypothetical protein GCM10010885_08190 [Alicyclobacillus cellulosilyticus]
MKLRSFLGQVQGNARGCLIYEPMWVIPWTLFSTYASVYMLDLGLSDTQIGWVTTLNLSLQIVGSFLSGYLTDRLGRRRALLLFDLVSWSCATLLWAGARNVWWFVLAALFNAWQKVPNTAWYCLLVEDTRPEQRPLVFTVLQFIGVVSGLFAPVAGLLVHRLGVVTAGRWLYALAFVSMTAMFLLRNRAVHETEIGLRKMRETRHIQWREALAEDVRLLFAVFSNRVLWMWFVVYILNNFQMAVRNTYTSIYLVAGLHLPAGWVAVFTAVASVVMLILMGWFVPRLRPDRGHVYMLWGFGLGAAGTALFALAPARQAGWVVLSTAVLAAGSLLATPYLETAVANQMDDGTRARVLSALTVLVMVATAPAGILGGWLYSLQPRLPFALVTGIFVLACAMVWRLSPSRRKQAAY